MPKLTIAAVRSAAITLTLLLAGVGAGACGGADDPEIPDPGTPGQVEPGEGSPALNPGACAAVARGGKVDICHVSDLDSLPVSALSVPVETCSTTHAAHTDDFLADRESGCNQKKKKCTPSGKPCKLGQSISCCSGTCGVFPGSGKKTVCF
jgi:hypothetical protein